MRIPPPTWRDRYGWPVVRSALGLLLLTAAVFKLRGLAADPLSQDAFFAAPQLKVAVIQVEALLGLWLLCGWLARVVWIVTLFFFGLLGAASLYLALTGQTSCGCFGQVKVSPWLTFGIDLMAIAALALIRPGHEATPSLTPWLRSLGRTLAGAAALLVLVGGVFLLLVEDPATALARLRGDTITLEPGTSDLGDGLQGEKRPFTVTLRNHTDQPIRIEGGTVSGLCVVTDDLPVTVPPRATQTISIRMIFTGGQGRFQHRFQLFTSDPRHRILHGQFTGWVRMPVAVR